MKAAETRVDRFLASSETAFAIPVYQRNYDWTRIQCQQLFNDILTVGAGTVGDAGADVRPTFTVATVS